MSQSPTSVQTLTGTQVPMDLAQILDMLAGQQNTANATNLQYQTNYRGQTLSDLADQRGNATTQRGQDISAAESQAQINSGLQQAMAQFLLGTVTAKAQYAKDVATVGIDQANLNFQQRQADATNALQTQTMQLQQSQQGYTQRQGAANTKLQALQMLADRTGPQDWVRYASLLRNVGTPVPQGTTVDPTKFADNLVDARFRDPNADPGYVTGVGSVNQPVDVTSSMPSSASLFDNLQFPNSPGGTNIQMPPSLQTTQPTGGPVYPIGTPTAGQQAGVTTPATTTPAGTSYGADNKLFDLSGNATAARSGWLTNGVAQDTGPDALKSQAHVAMLSKGTGNVAQMLAALHQMAAQHMAMHGQPQPGMDTPPQTQMQPAPPGMTTDQTLVTGDAPTSQNPSAGGAKPEMIMNPTGAPLAVANHADTKKLLKSAIVSHSKKPKRHASGTMDNERNEVATPAQERAEGEAPIKVKAHTRRRMPRAASGTGMAMAQLKRYAGGTDQYGMPTDPSYTTYTGSQYGNQPFLQVIRGQAQATPFGAFGAQLSNPAYGLNNMPNLLNLQQFQNLDPSEEDATKGAYQNALGVDFRDVLAGSQRAAPIGSTLAATRFGGRGYSTGTGMKFNALRQLAGMR